MSSQPGQRPLSELSPLTQRRNSPSWNQTTKMVRSGDSVSSYDVSSSPRLFWQGRDSSSPFQRSTENQAPYDPETPFPPPKRPSLENLKSVSRVKNSAMFRDRQGQYDPTQVYVPQRPMATGRSLQKQDEDSPASNELDDRATGQPVPRPPSPSKDQASPAKSSLSKASRFGAKGGTFDPGSEIWSDIDGYRLAKCVTFDAAPPQVNEYEMTTPDPSSVASGSLDGSYDSEEDEGDVNSDHDASMDRDDSFDASLEDIEKTPVVLPEDWRFVSPSNANDALVKEDDDPFAELGRHDPNTRPSSVQKQPAEGQRLDDSNGERRPLPPLPSTTRPLSYGPGKLAAAFELGSGEQRNMPGPFGPASHSKSEITNPGRASMSIEDRLRLMMIHDKCQGDSVPGEREHDARDTNLTSERDRAANGGFSEKLPANRSGGECETSGQESFFSPPRISRASILRDIRKGDNFLDDESYERSSPIESRSRRDMNYDPDVPVPSVEDHHDDEDDDDDTNSVIVKEEEVEEDLYSISQYYEQPSSRDLSFKDLNQRAQGVEGHYAPNSAEPQMQKTQGVESPPTPVPGEQAKQHHNQGGCDETRPGTTSIAFAPEKNAMRDDLHRPVTPTCEEKEMSEPSTPESVIRHSVDEEDPPEEPIPDPVATVKAHGTGLKTRPSFTPADMESMAATRRKISGQQPPSIPAYDKQYSGESGEPNHDSRPPESSQQLGPPIQFAQDNPQRQSSLVKLDIPFSIQEESLGFGLDKEFDRVIESQKVAFELSLSCSPHFPLSFPVTQIQDPLSLPSPGHPKDFNQHYSGISADRAIPKQRGYLMRQNTKVIVARAGDEEPSATNAGTPVDNRGTRSAGSSPRKASQQTWTTEPWNGKIRRSSTRMTNGIPKKKPVPGAVPPLPGQPSNVQDTTAAIEENEPALNEAIEDGGERGRLFVKVVGMKYLDLPLPRGERSYFALTLDNGLHCVTTSWLELGKSAPIGQEFELVVQNDLEFHFTLQMKVDQDKLRPQEAASSSPTRQKASKFSRVFASPRKRREMEMRLQQDSQQQKSTDLNTGVWDTLRTLIARDGSFARAYVSLSDHEKYAFGRPYTVDVACFNEWATEEQPSSVKSKRSTASANSQRKPPYKIGKLELQLLFVPKPKGVKDTDMPKSMNACIREMCEAETISSRRFEGFLSQQGGDCPFWRRRFFKLQGSKLTAFHETTRQPRATINLSKAAKLIDDKSSLVQKETTTKGGGRRKSAFAEEEEGYMFVEEGFRIRFANGEVIDFYADNATDKESWLRVLSESVGKGTNAGNGQKQWTEVVLRRERSMKVRRETTDRFPARGPPPPTMSVRKDVGPGLPPARPRHKHTQSQPEVRGTEVQRNKARAPAL